MLARALTRASAPVEESVRERVLAEPGRRVVVESRWGWSPEGCRECQRAWGASAESPEVPFQLADARPHFHGDWCREKRAGPPEGRRQILPGVNVDALVRRRIPSFVLEERHR